MKKVKPEFPRNSVGGHAVGDVQLDARITEEGNVSQIWVLRPAGQGRDEAAVEAVKQWKFTPAKCEGKPATADAPVTIHFVID